MRQPVPGRLALPVAASLAAALLLAACAAGGGAYDEGMKLVADGNHEAAVMRLREALRLEPTNGRYRIELLNEQAALARERLERADEARAAGRLDEAEAYYRGARQAEPGNERAWRGIDAVQLDRKHLRQLDDAERLLREGNLDGARRVAKLVLDEDSANTRARKLISAVGEQKDKLDQDRAAQNAAQSVLRRPVTLQFRDANLRMVFEALSRTTGLNVILDRDVRADLKTTIFVKDAAVEDTVDLILLQNQLEKRALNASTLFVYPATAAKQKEYQDLQVRTFQIANADAKYLQNVLKTVLKVKDVSVDDRTNTLVIRDTADAIAVAAKVIAAHDVADAEVMLEVEVLEVSHARLNDLGIQFPTSVTLGTPTSAGTVGAVRRLGRNDLTISPLSISANFQLQDTDANLLASPRIRARNKEKARILIGDRVPTITNTVTPVATGTPVITGTVQYQEVGLKLEFEPQVYNDQEVGIKINLEVSNIVKEYDDPQGGRSYQIGTRNAQTSLRLRDGETQILGGLISDEDRNTADKIPGLGHLPMVGKVFGNNNGTRTKSELILSITPHIVRAPAVTEMGVRDVFSGTESSIRERALRLDPVGEFRGQSGQVAPRPAMPASAPAVPTPAAETAPATPAPSTGPAPALAPVPVPVPVPVPAAPAAAPVAPPPAPSSDGGGTDLSWGGATTARVGDNFQVQLSATGLPALRELPLTLRFDPVVLRFVDATLGTLAQQAGGEQPAATVDALRGRVDIPLKFAQPAALAGDGALLTLTFAVKTGRATTQLIASQIETKAEDGSPRMLTPGPRSVVLRLTP